MKFLRNLIMKKKLEKLTKEITEKTDFREVFSSDTNKKKEALEEYLYTCIESDDISELMIEFNLNKESLEQIYHELVLLSLGQWVKNNYIALATLNNYETLGFYLISKNSGIEKSSIAETLYDYWDGSIEKGDLLKLINAHL